MEYCFLELFSDYMTFTLHENMFGINCIVLSNVALLCKEKEEQIDKMEAKPRRSKIEKKTWEQYDIEEAAVKVARIAKHDSNKAVKETPENARIREETATRCTKVMKRRAQETSEESQSRLPFLPQKNMQSFFFFCEGVN